MIDREQLINDANELGLEFPKNIKTSDLLAKVCEAKGIPVPVDEVPPSNPPTKDESQVDVVKKSNRDKILQRKKEALTTRIVTITNRDNRENSYTTTASLSFENQYFGLSKIVPLDVPVELEQALIDIAENTMMTLHKDEIVDGKRTGNKIAVPTKKYSVSYAKE